MSELQFSEYLQLTEAVDQEYLTDEQYDLVDYHSMKWNPVSGNVRVTFFDDQHREIAAIEFPSEESAEVWLEDNFEIDEFSEMEFDEEE